MNINEVLWEAFENYGWTYFVTTEKDFQQFLFYRGTFVERQQLAGKIIRTIMWFHAKSDLLDYLSDLARAEIGARKLQPWARDHVVHALLSYMLGIYLQHELIEERGLPRIPPFQWKLAGLFHDVGYPVQIANEALIKPYEKTINDIRKRIDAGSTDVSFRIVPQGLQRLTHNINAFDLIEERLNQWGLRTNVQEEYDIAVNSGSICHGIISSLAVLNVIDLLYQKYNPDRQHKTVLVNNVDFNQAYFLGDVVSACTAIFMHNLPSRSFAAAKIDRSKAPLAFILKLSDALQEWERPSDENESGLPSSDFSICIKKGKLIFNANVDEKIKDKIRAEISSSLNAVDVFIV